MRGSKSHEERQTDGHAMRPRRRQAESHMAGQETETWIGMPCRVRLDIYLVGYGREEGEGEKNRE